MNTILGRCCLKLCEASVAAINRVVKLIATTAAPILFTSLSHLRGSASTFGGVFFSFRGIINVFILPLKMNVFLFQSLVAAVLLKRR